MSSSSTALWFKDAVIYELHVKTFYDSNGDGIGDFRGLIEKLDYFAELGVTAIWLLPFYPSPLRDDGYDIADYYNVNPSYGTLDDFREFLDEAHKRGLRVITELVINHTSDQNAWFQAARRAPKGSPLRDFYVWSDTPDKYTEARIIFKDFEPSNWSWDPVAQQYYWHRFFHHQPDLNFDNPAVHAEVEKVFEFWLDMGVDGLRLDAVPYLYEREGTNCENLTETHDYLKKLRATLDVKYGDRMLLAEANQWPEDAAAYFGDGDECHMNFHFPIMPRLFMSLQMEDRFPIIDILNQTPAIPPSCQWATFLRNHDELTLEMVTDEERDYMYRVYAADTRARINLGIRRRLAPLLGNNRRRIELINALLFSLPGTPIVYYGDEIGMGDNFYLGDRNGVRTPMQWAPDRNGGFSKANPQQLYLPAIIDPEYHYEAINVENQRRNTSSLFWWMRRLIVERKRWRAFGHGTIRFFHPDNAKVLAFVREDGDDAVLVLANLSRFTQAAEIDLSEFAGVVPVEIFSRSKFPELKPGGTMFTLGPHDFYWLALPRKGANSSDPAASVPTLEGRIDLSVAVGGPTRDLLERQLLPMYFENARWFKARSRYLRDLRITDDLPLGTGRLLLITAAFTEGMPETYLLPLEVSTGEQAARFVADSPRAVLARFREGEEEQVLHDALLDSNFRATLLESFAKPGSRAARLLGLPGQSLHPEEIAEAATKSHIISLEGSNSTIAYGDKYLLKLFRRLEPGKQPEEESTRYLNEVQGFQNVAPHAGTLQLLLQDRQKVTAALLLGYVQNQGDAYAQAVDSCGRFLERVVSQNAEAITPESLVEIMGAVSPERARLLGQRVAELHLAFAADRQHATFAPEPYTSLYQRSLYQAVRGHLLKTTRLLQSRRADLGEEGQALATELVSLEGGLLQRYNGLLSTKISALKTTVHGSLHLGQILSTGKDFIIIDLEGDASRPLSERSLKRSPLVDVASMISSCTYAAYAALRRQQPQDQEKLRPWTEAWAERIIENFLQAYFEIATPSGLLPTTEADRTLLLEVFRADRAVAELNNELAFRPEMAVVPLRTLVRLAQPTNPTPPAEPPAQPIP